MPRRPRPAARPAPANKGTGRKHDTTGNSMKPAQTKPKPIHTRFPIEVASSAGSADEDGSNDFAQGSSRDSSAEAEEQAPSDDDRDADAPRVAQWVDEDDLEGNSDSEDEVVEEEIESPVIKGKQLISLENNLSSMPLGSLRKAQKALAQDNSDSDSNESFSDDEPEAIPSVSNKGKEKEWSIKPRKDIAKRSNKHAPTEVTSKRPVTRFRPAVEIAKSQVRDPRFLPLTGEFDPRRFQSSYGFLSELHSTESKTLRENLKRARKQLISSPRDLREERAAEVARLEGALKRAESTVNRDKREQVEREALEKLAREEKERRQQGKGAWYMKNADKKEVLVKARYEALAAAGGKSAVKKAIEKKQKKISQKEKKSRPFDARTGGASSRGPPMGGGKRASDGREDSRPSKRPRLG